MLPPSKYLFELTKQKKKTTEKKKMGKPTKIMLMAM